MIEYILLAIAFAIMIHIRYVHESLIIVKDFKNLMDITNEDTNYSPVLFSLAFFMYSAVFAPVIAFYIFTSERMDVVKDISNSIIKSYFQLEEK
jgi:hypothetical protein